jgi:hypothetical protein
MDRDRNTSKRKPSNTHRRRPAPNNRKPPLLESLININPSRTSANSRDRLVCRKRHAINPTHIDKQSILDTRRPGMVSVSSTLDRELALVFAHDLDSSRHLLG